MSRGKQNKTDGFSLVEVLTAIAVLGFVVVPACTGLVLSFRVNARSEQLMRAELAVSRAVETLMAEGYDDDGDYTTRFPEVAVTATADPDSGSDPVIGYDLTVTSRGGDVEVHTYVRPAESGGGGT